MLPILSAGLTLFCSACIQYTSQGSYDLKSVLRTFWIPPLGIFCTSVFILPLEMMQSEVLGPLNALIATSILVNGVLVLLLQVYASGKCLSQSESDSDSDTGSGKALRLPPREEGGV